MLLWKSKFYDNAALPTRAYRKGIKMLILTRGRNESIVIGDNIEVTVADVRGNKVRLGINAPKDVSVHRKEVYEEIQSEIEKNSVSANPSGTTR